MQKKRQKKVYCKNCKFSEFNGVIRFECTHPKNTKETDSSYSKTRVYAPVDVINENNDCSDLKWKSIWHRLGMFD